MRNGRGLVTRIGKIELRVPRDRSGEFSTALFERFHQTSWREFLLSLKQRGLSGVEFAVTDDHAGLKKAIAEILPQAAWQRCDVRFPRNSLDYLPRKADDDCLQELRWLHDRMHLAEAQRDLAAWLEDNRYINMDLLREERKEQFRKTA